jgi:serine/threonine-protein kinase
MTGGQQRNAPVSPGDLLAGKYRVERVLGAGAMGVVVVAMHTQLEQRVAIKFLLPEVLGNQEAAQRFAREAKAAARIRSEHVARVLDVSTLEGGEPYMVMEYLEGQDLGAMLEQRGALPLVEAVDYVLQALEALCEAHLAGVIHRDLKPSNMFLARRPDGSPIVKILDFGISKIESTGQQGMTQTQAVLGSPLYMSPEQMRMSRSVDQRADIWSMGVVLFQLVTNGFPFTAESITQLIATVMFDPAPRLSQARPGLPPNLDDVVMRCLEKEPSARFQNVGELAVALAPFAPAHAQLSIERITRMLRSSGLDLPETKGSVANAPVPAAPALAQSGTANEPLGSSGQMVQAWQASHASVGERRRSPAVGIALGAVALVVVLGIGGALLARRSSVLVTTPAVGTPASMSVPPAQPALPSAAPATSLPAASAETLEPLPVASVVTQVGSSAPRPSNASKGAAGAPPPRHTTTPVQAAPAPTPVPAPVTPPTGGNSDFGGRH